MDVKLRPGRPEDADACGIICYQAFRRIAGEHNYPPDFPAPEVATGLLSMLFGHPGFYSVVAEVNGKVVGSNFLDERSTILGVGPITVDPAVQNHGIGRVLMQDVIQRAAEKDSPGIRLLQAAYHNRCYPCMRSSASKCVICSLACKARRRRARSPGTRSGAPPPRMSRPVP